MKARTLAITPLEGRLRAGVVQHIKSDIDDEKKEKVAIFIIFP